MATATPSPPISPHEEAADNDNHQPPIACSPPQARLPSPPLPTEYVDHQQQFTNSISHSWPPQQPENSPDHPPPEDLQEHPVPLSPPPEEKFDRQQPLPPPPPSPSSLLPPSPTPTGTERPPENFESPPSKQPPSPSSMPPAGPEDPVEGLDYHINPKPKSGNESPLSKQQASSGPDDHVNSPNSYQNPSSNPNLDHESPSPTSPAKFQANPSPKASQSPKDPSPSPPLTTRSPSSPQDTLEPNTALTPPLGVPLLLHAAASSSPSKPQISPWTHQETANLIQAYQEKWYSLKKGSLKAGQWEEVAITVAARCGYDEPTKTAKQCRHKIEKLRKRYRAERGKPQSKATGWNFFKLMDNLEKGPLPISSSPPMALVEYQKSSNSNGKRRKLDEDEDEEDDGDREFHLNKRSSRSKNYNHHVPNGYATRNLRFSDGGTGSRVVRGLRTPVVHKQKGFYREDDGEDEEDEVEEQGGEEEGVAAQLAVEIKGFAEKFVKMENKKMEMIRDVERYRLEMENKRMEMILESQQMLVDTVNKAFSSSNKTHKLSAK